MGSGDARRPRPTRREVIAAAGASALALTAGAGFAARPRRERLRVRRSRRHRQAQAGRSGIAGVLVSNGRDVVRTDADGRWRSARRRRRQPVRDQAAALGDTRRARRRAALLLRASARGQSYGHRLPPRRRRPDRRAAGQHRFPSARRRRAPASMPCCSPTHSPRTMRSSDTCATTSSPACSASGAAFGINHGDVVFDDLSLYPRYLQIIGATGIPWHHCPGNHDINSEARDDGLSRETWKRVFGPRHYAFQYARSHLHPARQRLLLRPRPRRAAAAALSA